MLDFSGLGRSADQMAHAATDIVEKLGNIERLQRINNILLATIIAEEYGKETGYRADVQSVLLSAITRDDSFEANKPEPINDSGGWELHRDNCTRSCFGIDPDTKSCQSNGCEHHPVLV